MLKLRKLRAAFFVAETGRVAHAARELNLSQPAVTRAVQSLEGELGTVLFRRSSRHLTCTEAGEALTRRIARALDHLHSAEIDLAPDVAGKIPNRARPLSGQAADHEFRAVIAIATSGTISAAARQSGLSQPALNRSLRALETRLGVSLFHRTSEGMRPTPAGELLIRRAKLALSEIRQGVEELEIIKGAAGGHLRIGALPLTRVRLVPFAVEALLARYEAAEVVIIDGTYESLLGSLRSGDLDVIAGTIRVPPAADDVTSEELFRDDVVIVARADHFLANERNLQLERCLEQGWILPLKGVPLRMQFERMLTTAGLPRPKRIIETNSLATARTLLMNSERLAIVSRHQVHHETMLNVLRILPVHLGDVVRPVGLTLRRDYVPTPLARAFFDELRRTAAQISDQCRAAA